MTRKYFSLGILINIFFTVWVCSICSPSNVCAQAQTIFRGENKYKTNGKSPYLEIMVIDNNFPIDPQFEFSIEGVTSNFSLGPFLLNIWAGNGISLPNDEDFVGKELNIILRPQKGTQKHLLTNFKELSKISIKVHAGENKIEVSRIDVKKKADITDLIRNNIEGVKKILQRDNIDFDATPFFLCEPNKYNEGEVISISSEKTGLPGKVKIKFYKSGVSVPNIFNLSRGDAKKILSGSGLKYDFEGNGEKVKYTEPEINKCVDPQSEVTVYLYSEEPIDLNHLIGKNIRDTLEFLRMKNILYEKRSVCSSDPFKEEWSVLSISPEKVYPGGRVDIKYHQSGFVVPNVSASRDDAETTLESMGIYYETEGKGNFIEKIEPEVGECLALGSKVTVYLQESLQCDLPQNGIFYMVEKREEGELKCFMGQDPSFSKYSEKTQEITIPKDYTLSGAMSPKYNSQYYYLLFFDKARSNVRIEVYCKSSNKLMSFKEENVRNLYYKNKSELLNKVFAQQIDEDKVLLYFMGDSSWSVIKTDVPLIRFALGDDPEYGQYIAYLLDDGFFVKKSLRPDNNTKKTLRVKIFTRNTLDQEPELFRIVPFKKGAYLLAPEAGVLYRYKQQRSEELYTSLSDGKTFLSVDTFFSSRGSRAGIVQLYRTASKTAGAKKNNNYHAKIIRFGDGEGKTSFADIDLTAFVGADQHLESGNIRIFIKSISNDFASLSALLVYNFKDDLKQEHSKILKLKFSYSTSDREWTIKEYPKQSKIMKGKIDISSIYVLEKNTKERIFYYSTEEEKNFNVEFMK